MVHAQHPARKTRVPKNEGTTVNFRRLASFTAATTALTEGTPGAATQVTVTAVSATVSQYGQYTQLTDVVQTQTIDSLVMEIAEAYGENMGDTIDQVVRDVLLAGTTVLSRAA